MSLDIELIKNRLNAASGVIAINSPNAVEDELITKLVAEVAEPLDYRTYYWNLTKSLRQVTLTRERKSGAMTGIKKNPVEGFVTDNPVTGLFQHIRDCKEQALFLIANVHEFLPGGLQPNLFVLQDLIDLCREIKRSDKRIILIGDRLRLSHHFDGAIFEMDNPLPTETEREQNLEFRLADIKAQSRGKVQIALSQPGKQNLIRAMGGITKEEADDLLLEASITHKTINDNTAEFIKLRRTAKMKKRGIETLDLPTVRAEGLDNLDRWLDRKGKMFAPKAQEYGLDLPGGCLIVGVQGTGKSLAVKNMAVTWQMPVFNMNIGRMMDRHVGGSEENLDTFLKEVESQTCIVCIEELDKQFAAIAKNATGGDGGTSQRLLGTFLQWLNDKRERRVPVFVVATANRIDHLPSELLRVGRWDGTFYVGLPKRTARTKILKAHMQRRKISLPDEQITQIAAATEGFNGAELEQLVVTCAEEAFIAERPGQVSLDEFIQAALVAPVQSRNPDEQEKNRRLEEWARQSAIPASSEVDQPIEPELDYASDRKTRF